MMVVMTVMVRGCANAEAETIKTMVNNKAFFMSRIIATKSAALMDRLPLLGYNRSSE